MKMVEPYAAGDDSVETVEAALSFLSPDDAEEAERVAMQLIGAGGVTAVLAISQWCRRHPEEPLVALLSSIAKAEGKKLASPV